MISGIPLGLESTSDLPMGREKGMGSKLLVRERNIVNERMARIRTTFDLASPYFIMKMT